MRLRCRKWLNQPVPWMLGSVAVAALAFALTSGLGGEVQCESSRAVGIDSRGVPESAVTKKLSRKISFGSHDEVVLPPRTFVGDGEVVPFGVQLANRGTSVIMIDSWRTSCACLEMDPPAVLKVDPGASVSLSLRYRVSGPGLMDQSLALRHPDGPPTIVRAVLPVLDGRSIAVDRSVLDLGGPDPRIVVLVSEKHVTDGPAIEIEFSHGGVLSWENPRWHWAGRGPAASTTKYAFIDAEPDWADADWLRLSVGDRVFGITIKPR